MKGGCMTIIEDKICEVLGEDAPPLISRTQAAELLGVSKGTLDSMISNGSISEIEGTKKLATADVCKFMARQNLSNSGVPAAEVDRIVEAVN